MKRIQNSILLCKTIVQLNMKRYCIVFILGVMTLIFFELLGDVAFAGTVEQNKPNQSPVFITDPNVLKDLGSYGTQLNSSPSKKEQESRDRLRRIIEQIQSVRFESEVETLDDPVEVNEAPVQEPNETSPNISGQETKVEESENTEEVSSKEAVSDQTMSMLKTILEYPDQLDDPLELGELLFASDNTKDAVICYQEALKRADPNDVRLSQDRAWILFQIGNCQRNHEPSVATETYRRLLVEYPDSLWADLAKVQKEYIDWSLVEKPRELIIGPESSGNLSNEN